MTKTGSASETVICTYRVQSGKEDAFTELLSRHWPSLNRLGLVTADLPVHYKGFDESNKPFFVEIFCWKDGSSADTAHEIPEVMAIWELMGMLTEERGAQPAMEFPHVQPLTLPLR